MSQLSQLSQLKNVISDNEPEKNVFLENVFPESHEKKPQSVKLSSWLEPNSERAKLKPEIKDGQFLHFCPDCGRWASVGVGVDLLKEKLGRWFCVEHAIGVT